MSTEVVFPSLEGFEPTRQTLQLYSRVISAVPRAHGKFHPQWWHVSLRVQPDGLITEEVALADGRALRLKMDLVGHVIVLTVDGEAFHTLSMLGGTSSTSMANEVLDAVAGLGLEGEVERDKFENDALRDYDPDQVAIFLTALVNADRIFREHRASLSGEMGPVQLWPHGFDLAFEWFGTQVQVYEEEGKQKEYRSQLNLGFFPGSPGVEPYFYSNPWPFEAEALLGQQLTEGASWHTEGWQGAILPYAALVGDKDAAERLRTFARRVHMLASPTLSADWAGGSGSISQS